MDQPNFEEVANETAGTAGSMNSAGAGSASGDVPETPGMPAGTGRDDDSSAAGSDDASDDDSAECQPGVTKCEGTKQQVLCSADATWQQPTECAFVCVVDRCAGVCSPGDVDCDGSGNATACDAEGTWQVAESCTSGVCENGACVAVCTEGLRSCSEGVLSECQSGESVAIQDCPFVCRGDACTGICEPGSQACVDGLLATCDATGQYDAGIQCPFVCANDACGGTCEPGATRCRSQAVQETCSAAGDWGEQPCDFVCLDSTGACGGSCTPGARRCVNDAGQVTASGTGSQVCSDQGEWGTTITCNEGCAATQCTGPCAAGSAAECVLTGADYGLRQCIGGQWETSPCTYVCSAGECSGVCTPGATRCETGSEEHQQCGPLGTWVAQACGASQRCKDGACIDVPVISAFTFSPNPATIGENVTLMWTLTGGAPTEIAITPGVGQTLDPSARDVMFVPSASTTFTLVVTNFAGSATATVSVPTISGGKTAFVAHYGSDSWAQDLVLGPAGEIISLSCEEGSFGTVSGQCYFAEHNKANGSLSRVSGIAATDDMRTLTLDGNTFVAGGTAGGLNVLGRFDTNFVSTGRETFFVNYDYPQYIYDVEVASSGNVIALSLASYVFGDGRRLFQVDSNFTNVVVSTAVPQPHDIALDSTDDIHAVSVSGSPGLRRLSGIADTSADAVDETLTWTLNGIAVASNGNIYATGTGLLVGYSNSLGSRVMYEEMSGEGSHLCLDSVGNVVVAGWEGDGIFVDAYTPGGNELWKGPRFSSSGRDSIKGVVCAADGAVFLVGQAENANLSGTGGAGKGAFVMKVE